MTHASPSVGVGTGKIILNDVLGASTTYSLPTMTVYNDGDEPGQYEMEVTFNEKQPQLKPSASWVEFSPKSFMLAPGSAQQVSMTITLPTNVKTGDYYAYLEAHGVASPSQETHIIAAAAAKFYFSAQNSQAQAAHEATLPKKPGPHDASQNPLMQVPTIQTQFEPLLKQITNHMGLL